MSAERRSTLKPNALARSASSSDRGRSSDLPFGDEDALGALVLRPLLLQLLDRLEQLLAQLCLRRRELKAVLLLHLRRVLELEDGSTELADLLAQLRQVLREPEGESEMR